MLITFYDTIIALQVQVFDKFFLNGVYKWHLVKKIYNIIIVGSDRFRA